MYKYEIRRWLNREGLKLCLGKACDLDPFKVLRARIIPELERRLEVQRMMANHNLGLVRCEDGVFRPATMDHALVRHGMHIEEECHEEGNNPGD